MQRGNVAEEIRRHAKFASSVLRIFPQHIFSDISGFFDQLPRINEDFEIFGGEQVPTVCFYETKRTSLGYSELCIVPRENAILPNAENRALDANHRNLINFSSAEDGSLLRVIGSMQRLVDKALKWTGVTTKRVKDAEEPTAGIKILSLDGGGVRGLFSILILEALMDAIRQIDTPDSPDALKPCDYFDLICGTSTGGLLAIMLGRLRMDVRVCKQAYRDLSKQIFQKTVWSFPLKKWWDAYWDKPWFSGERLESAIRTILSQQLSTHEKNVLQSQGIAEGNAPLRPHQDLTSRCFVCALVEGQRECGRLRSYSTRNIRAPDFTICEAGRATCAAPLYFPPITIAGCRYFDGGLESNNPILEAIRETNQEYPNRTVAAIVSIGTGKCEPVGPGGGLLNFVNCMVDRVTDTEAKHYQFLEFFPGLRDVYSRLQETDRLGSIDLADWQKLDEIEQLAHVYLSSAHGRAEIKRCARKIARNGNAT